MSVVGIIFGGWWVEAAKEDPSAFLYCSVQEKEKETRSWSYDTAKLEDLKKIHYSSTDDVMMWRLIRRWDFFEFAISSTGEKDAVVRAKALRRLRLGNLVDFLVVRKWFVWTASRVSFVLFSVGVGLFQFHGVLVPWQGLWTLEVSNGLGGSTFLLWLFLWRP